MEMDKDFEDEILNFKEEIRELWGDEVLVVDDVV
jgi:hypothetical protein